ncbi:hydantoinase [Ochrobactrum sp. MYb15]|uniref:hydantoinase/oxoprolinase family protein n=1 Tax=Brucella TaxID=234 RepID=UPI0004661A27|nr:hydantoinase/oxoprolinase family protein [Brucella rhizosphaerae]PQZ50024.1 hydantoinase [Ochrobactrum sp. MYb19]PRA68066.1 hydantoinase [Ochrobactrum sp. MYb18]PRA74706.1 hydantoinase [Brucella thiophenivorans]PRA90316.1 hydantoinase [Ochrobactrum sp. MYb14]PRA95767.1 hydantoinase [Ochrobactrum sp. MYb15]
MQKNGARIGIDVGGTFTDFVLFDPDRKSLIHYKEPSTPEDPSQALIVGLQSLLKKADLGADQIDTLMHGTTIGLNAIIQRRGAKIALIVSEGYRDILEIARSRMPSSFDFHASKEEPLVPRHRIIEVGARLSANGTTTQLPDDTALEEVAAQLNTLDVDAAALVLINGYTNPSVEKELAQKISEKTNGLSITSAAAIWPEIREYERTLIACLNAYIQPLMQRYFEGLKTGLARDGVHAPILVTASNGGSLSIGSAQERPVETILSGPASGVMAAARLAATSGVRAIITFDMGGTSSDIAVAQDGSAALATKTDIGGLPLVLPVVDVSAIGAGGGSIVWVDDHGVLKVGPRSAGAMPGPISYGRGGTEPTVTDCYLTLGYIDPAGFLGGRMQLESAPAAAALAQIGNRIGFQDENAAAEAAQGSLAVTTAGMATELYKTLAVRGLDPASFALVPFGGAGPTHANLLAEEVGIARIVVPPAAGTFCALGAAAADLRRDFVRSLRRELDEATAATLAETFEALAAEGNDWLDQEGEQSTGRLFEKAADMRYVGQAYELRVALNDVDADVHSISEAFHREHERIYGFRDSAAEVELGTARLAVIGVTPDLAAQQFPTGDGKPGIKGKRRLFHKGAWLDADIYDRHSFRANDQVSGPAIIEQDDTTTILLPGWIANCDKAGNLHLERLAQ